jgi:WD40 repeat protein
MPFDGFISYSHAADGRLAPAVQRGLHRLGKPWHRRRALWIFRDQTGLAVTPGLWSSIQTALDGSEYFVLLASPEAARSPWVNREIEHWIATKSAARVLPVVSDGEWAWDPERGDFTEDSTAVPAALRGVFAEEPFFLDLRWARGDEHLSLQHSRFRDAIAQLAAPMHGVSKDELEGEDVRQHRRAKRVRSGAVATVVVMALLAAVTGFSAVHNADRARNAAAEALRQQQVADSQRSNAEKSAAEARRQQALAEQQQTLAKQQQTRAQQAAAAADQSEQVAREQQTLADQATAEAHRQQQLATEAKSRTKQQQELAREASDRAQRLQAQAERLAKTAAQQRELADQAAAEARAQQAKADQQQRIAVSRRLMNQAGSMLVDDPKTALMLGTAAQKINPDPETTGELAGDVAATHFAGAIGGVYRAAYGPDGILATFAGNGEGVSLWNVGHPLAPVQIAKIPGPFDAGSELVFSPDGRTLAMINSKHRIELWDVARPSRPARLVTLPADGPVGSMAFGGTTFAESLQDGSTVLFDLSDRTHPVQAARLTDFPGVPVNLLAISPNGRLLIVDKLRFVTFYDLSDPTDPQIVDGLLSFGGSPLAFSPDSMTLAAGDPDGIVRLYDLKSYMSSPGTSLRAAPDAPSDAPSDPDGTSSPPPIVDLPPDTDPFQLLVDATGPIDSLVYSPDGNRLAAVDENGSATVWNEGPTGNNEVLASLKAKGALRTVSFDPAGDMLVTAGDQDTATLWNVAPPGDPALVSTIALPTGEYVRTSNLGTDGRSLIVANADGTANTWNVANPAEPLDGGRALTLFGGPVQSVAFSPDGRTEATVSEDATVRVAPTARPDRTTSLTTFRWAVKFALTFSADGRMLAADAEGKLMVWNVADPAHPVLVTSAAAGGAQPALAFSADGRTLAVADASTSQITLVDPRHGARTFATLSDYSGHTISLAFSPNGHYLASGGGDHTATMWDVTDRAHPRRLATLAGQMNAAPSLAFSADNRTLAVGGDDGAVMLWDITAPSEPSRLAVVRVPYGQTATALAFRRDGHTLAVTGQYTVGGRIPAVVTLWNYSKLNSLRANPAGAACAITGRGLTASEWADDVPELPYRRTC